MSVIRKVFKWLMPVAIFAVVIMLLAGMNSPEPRPDSTASTSTTSTSTSTSTTSTTTTTVPSDDGLTDKEVADNCQTGLEYSEGLGFEPDQILCGEEAVPDNPLPVVEPDVANDQRGSAAFSDITLKTHAELCAFINGDTPEAQAIRGRAFFLLALVGGQPEEYTRWINCEGFVPFQYTVEVDVNGTTMFSDGQVIDLTKPRRAGEMDMFWFFFKKDGTLVTMVSLRAACGNPSFVTITPVTSASPPQITIDTPPDAPEILASKCLLTDRLGLPCGTPDGGQEYLPVQDNPAPWVQPTPGGLPVANPERVIPQQAPPAGGAPVITATPIGTQTPNPAGPAIPGYQGPGSSNPGSAPAHEGVADDPTGPEATHDNPLVGETAPAGSTAPDF